jgi:hypothetical protein
MATFSNEVSEPEETAIHGVSRGEGGRAIYGQGSAVGVLGEGDTWHGTAGISRSTVGGAGVYGAGDPGPGIIGTSTNWIGVYGETFGAGSDGAAGVFGEGKENGLGVKGVASAEFMAGVAGYHLTGTGPAIYGNGVTAGHFEGNVIVTGDIQLPNADCAEDFDIAESEAIEPGMVMVLDEHGALYRSSRPYDRRVAGVVSGAGNYRPGIVMDRNASDRVRQPIALMGKVFCLVDATYGAVSVGDLLTTSETPGHAMKAGDPQRAFGSVIGKAMRPLREGQGLVPILIALQ